MPGCLFIHGDVLGVLDDVVEERLAQFLVVISRPRNMIVMRALFPSSRKRLAPDRHPFASVFITEPVRKVPHSEYDASVFVELVDVTGAAGGGTLDAFQRDDVVLYR